jgi:hypothetical protein
LKQAVAKRDISYSVRQAIYQASCFLPKEIGSLSKMTNQITGDSVHFTSLKGIFNEI